MQDLTESVTRCREAVRHLWNVTFRATTVDWDARDRFSLVASELFSALVLEPLGATEQRLPEMFDATPCHFQRLAITPASDQIPIMINRGSASHGYWDDPTKVLRKGEAEMPRSIRV